MKRIAALAVVAALLMLAAGCSREKYDPDMKDPKQQEKDAKEMWENEPGK